MLYFQDEHWLRVNGCSRFSAYISPEDRQREDVSWFLHLTFLAAGPRWRRVQSWNRPRVLIEMAHFRVTGVSWRDLERADYWKLPGEEDDYWAWPEKFGCGGLEAHYHRGQGTKDHEQLKILDHMWRVARREGRWFTVELATFVDGREVREKMPEAEVAVTPDGRSVPEDRDAEFWKANAQLYLLEDVPFGTVTVRVPRNARDPEAYAVGRAREFIGIPEPEQIEVADFYRRDPGRETLHNDLYVDLHLHGFYED